MTALGKNITQGISASPSLENEKYRIEYQAVLLAIKAAGATLVAITPELPDASLSTSEKNDLEFEVLTDANSDYGPEIGIVFRLPERLRPIYESFGINVEEHNGEGQFDLPLSATFVVNVDGSIVCAFVDADYHSARRTVGCRERASGSRNVGSMSLWLPARIAVLEKRLWNRF